MKNQCRFCKCQFESELQEKHYCDDCKENIITILKEDKQMRLEFLEVVIKDEVVIERIAKEVFNVPVKNVGIGGEGTISEFFRTGSRTPT